MLGDTLADVPAPFPLPIGLRLSQAARAVERAFDEALGEAGGTLPVWLILLNLNIRKPPSQRELAEAVGVREATLTHHLNAMDARGLVTRTRDAANRRVQVVALTETGEVAFARLRDTATAFDAKLRARPRRRRPGDAQYPARPPSRQRRRGGSRPALGRPGRPPPGVTDLAATPAIRRPPPDPASTGQGTPPAASCAPVTYKIDAHPTSGPAICLDG